MIDTQVTIINKLGLHARAAAKLVSVTSQFRSRIQLAKGDRFVDAKSIMALLMMAASQGTTLGLRIEGEDEQLAHDAVLALINNRFDEAE